MSSALELFHPAARTWFERTFREPTGAQQQGWPPIARGESVLLLAPTGSGKTLAAFLWCIDRLMFKPLPARGERCRILYISPLKALAVDVERNLQAPIAGISQVADERGDGFVVPTVMVRSGDTHASERRRFRRDPNDILITTPESLYLLLTSNAREVLRSIDTVIVDEIHALVPTKRGAHLALSLERLEALTGRPLQRIGLSATQRPLEEVARFLGGVETGPQDNSRRGRACSARLLREIGPDDLENEFAGEVGSIRYRPVTIVDAGRRKPLELTVEFFEPFGTDAARTRPSGTEATQPAGVRPRRKSKEADDMSTFGEPSPRAGGSPAQSVAATSIWSAIHPRLVELVRAHRSTLLFVNNRRTAERLSAAINEFAGESLARAHHGSLAREQRAEIEEALKRGALRALVATSSLELGIDMGAIDLVIQIEAPPSVANGLQRIGRAGHRVDEVSRGVIFPKFRGDLLACATVTRAMHEGLVESSRYPRNPLDVLAQQIVATAAMDRWSVDDLFTRLRRAAPFASLSRPIFESVLDMLAGRYASDDFADLKPRLTWDRVRQTVVAREGARRVAVANAGTIPDRGLYGVFLVGPSTPLRAGRGAEGRSVRVGELDEEMVFESRAGETFVLGASTWRIEEITHDRVLVSPAPGEPGKMPFWRGDSTARPLEFGQLVGRLVRELRQMSSGAALRRLTLDHDLDERAAENLLRYIQDQAAATGGAVPDDETIVVERCRDELGDWRLCVLTPFGSAIHAPWSIAASAICRDREGLDVERMWTNDGFVIRAPESDDPPDVSLLVPGPEDVESLVVRELGGSSLFAAKFREVAARALLLPKRRPGGRTPLWQQRKRASDLLAAAARYPSFPMVLESYRECLRDVFDLAALRDTLARIRDQSLKIVTVDSEVPSPFASSLLFGYIANYIYEGDAPLAERRAQALAIDQAQLRELMGDADLRALLDADAMLQVERELQALAPGYRARTIDGIHDLLLRLGDLSADELAARTEVVHVTSAIGELTGAGRIVTLRMAGEDRLVAAEHGSRYRDGLGVPLPSDLPEPFLQSVADPLRDIVLRQARTHGPFTLDEVCHRYGIGARSELRTRLTKPLRQLVESGRLLEGGFRPGAVRREWCHADVLRVIRHRSLAKLRRDVEPVEPPVLGRLVATWQGVTKRRRGLDALLDAIQTLQGAPLPASVFEREILGARIEEYSPADLDALAAAGEIVWCGIEPLGDRDGRLALYLSHHFAKLRAPRSPAELGPERDARILEFLKQRGASFFGDIHAASGGGYPAETVTALWNLVWRGLITNDTFHALRAFLQGDARVGRRTRREAEAGDAAFRSRRLIPPAAEGRWSITEARLTPQASTTERSAAMTQQLLARYGLVTREVAASEGLPGGFSSVYDVLKRLEERGRVRRGYFVEGVAAAQFALPTAVDLLRSLRLQRGHPEAVLLAATDPANPYGSLLKWPAPDSVVVVSGLSRTDQDAGTTRSFSRVAGASVILVGGTLAAYFRRGPAHRLHQGYGGPGPAKAGQPKLHAKAEAGPYRRAGTQVWTFLPESEPERTSAARAVAARLAEVAREGAGRKGGLLIAEINGRPAGAHPLAPFLLEAGFVSSALGYHVPRGTAMPRLLHPLPRRKRLRSSPFGILGE